MSDARFKGFNFSKAIVFLLAFICLILAGAALKLTTPVILPFVIAVLLTFVLEPVIVMLERIRIPRVVAVVLAVTAVAAGIVFVGYILFGSAKTILTLYPKYEARFTEIYIRIATVFQLPYNEHLSLFQNLWDQLGLRERVQALAISASQSSLGLLTDATMVVLFVVFLLLELSHFRFRIGVALAGEQAERVKKIGAAVVTQVARYLSVKFFISLATGLLVGFLLTLIGMDFPIVWGIVSFILNFIPNIGSIAAGGGVTLFALVQFWPAPGPVIAAFSIMVGVNMILGNIVEPRIQGYNLGLSPFVILVSLLAWGWLWGFTGLVLAVPMTVIVKIVCENVPVLEPVSILMGSYRGAKRKARSFMGLKRADRDASRDED